jgi:RNA polymerase sigma-70 factor (ECF subfamily)
MKKQKFKKMSMDEQELVRQIQDGDEMAFTKIVNIYKDKIVNYLYQFTGDYQRAVDLSQETFMRVFFKANKYKPIAPFSSWIYAIASNLAKTEMKKVHRAPTVSLDDLHNSYSSGAFSENPIQSGLTRNIRQSLKALHPRYRIPVILKDMEGFSLEEIAQIMKRPVGTIKARISRGRNYLRRELEVGLKEEDKDLEKKENFYGRA